MKLVLFPAGDDESGDISDILENIVLSQAYWRQNRERKEICVAILEKLPAFRENPEAGFLLEDRERERLSDGMKLDGLTITPRPALLYFLQCSLAVDQAKTPK